MINNSKRSAFKPHLQYTRLIAVGVLKHGSRGWRRGRSRAPLLPLPLRLPPLPLLCLLLPLLLLLLRGHQARPAHVLAHLLRPVRQLPAPQRACDVDAGAQDLPAERHTG